MSKIIEHTSNGFKWLLVEVPEDANKLKIATTDDGITLLWYGLPILRGFFSIELPSPSWERVGKADSMTDEQWKEFVPPNLSSFTSATMMGQMILKYHGFIFKTTLILKSTQLL